MPNREQKSAIFVEEHTSQRCPQYIVKKLQKRNHWTACCQSKEFHETRKYVIETITETVMVPIHSCDAAAVSTKCGYVVNTKSRTILRLKSCEEMHLIKIMNVVQHALLIAQLYMSHLKAKIKMPVLRKFSVMNL